MICSCFRLWDIECGACLRVLEGHEELVRCIRFDSKRIVSGAYDGKIKVWDLVAALDPRAPSTALCLKTLEVTKSFLSYGVVRHLEQNQNSNLNLLSNVKIRVFASFFSKQEHTGRVFRLQFDEFQIVSSSHDDTILIWDFLNYTPPDRTVTESRRSPSRMYLMNKYFLLNIHI